MQRWVRVGVRVRPDPLLLERRVVGGTAHHPTAPHGSGVEGRHLVHVRGHALEQVGRPPEVGQPARRADAPLPRGGQSQQLLPHRGGHRRGAFRRRTFHRSARGAREAAGRAAGRGGEEACAARDTLAEEGRVVCHGDVGVHELDEGHVVGRVPAAHSLARGPIDTPPRQAVVTAHGRLQEGEQVPPKGGVRG
eukprot:scaffold55662_cov69-Phaeocystis_antarctica.AAC.4